VYVVTRGTREGEIFRVQSLNPICVTHIYLFTHYGIEFEKARKGV
jgi:hypothetical protein